MKHIYIFIIALCAAVFFSACEEKHESAPYLDPTPLMYMRIIKLSSKDYLPYVIADKTIDGTGYKIRCSVGGVCQELFLGTSPYIALPKDYYLLDWKWGDFIYRPSNYLIDVQWTDVQDVQQIWDLKATNAVDSFYHFMPYWNAITWEAIDKFLNIPPPTEYGTTPLHPIDYIYPNWASRFKTLSDVSKSVDKLSEEEYIANVHRQDSLNNIYIERLSRIIEADALGQVPHR